MRDEGKRENEEEKGKKQWKGRIRDERVRKSGMGRKYEGRGSKKKRKNGMGKKGTRNGKGRKKEEAVRKGKKKTKDKKRKIQEEKKR